MPIVAKSMLLFVLAGLCEISGGYLVWQWWRAGTHWGAGVVGALVLVLYGIVPTYQPAHFGRVYSAYGGWFVVLSMLWGWSVDRVPPDRYDVIGGLVCLLGVAIIMYKKVFDHLLETKEIAKRLDARQVVDLRYHPKAR